MSSTRLHHSFITSLAVSILLHLMAAGIILLHDRSGSSPPPPQTYIVDLQDLPAAETPSVDKPSSRAGEHTRRVPLERAPRGDDGRESRPAPPVRQTPGAVPQPAPVQTEPPGDLPVREGEPLRGEGLFRPRGTSSQHPPVRQLMPRAEQLGQLEDAYRKKFHEDVAEGEAHFVNTDDILFGSFLRRFETAVYGVWRYPEEAVRLGIEGMVPTRIVFNRRGEIVKVEILESSGSRLLDNEVLRTLKNVGVVGGFPRNYQKETYTLIAFFHYGIRRGEVRSIR